MDETEWQVAKVLFEHLGCEEVPSQTMYFLNNDSYLLAREPDDKLFTDRG